MRAIGKGSLASLLSMGLHFTRIFLGIALVFLSIAVFVVPFIPIFIGLVDSVVDIDISGDVGIGITEYMEVTQAFVTIAVMFFVVSRLLEILKTLRFGSPFVKENADRFRGVGYALMIGEGAKFAYGFLSMVFDADLEINSSFLSWLSIIAVFVLAEVFHEGARMKEEQDLTV